MIRAAAFLAASAAMLASAQAQLAPALSEGPVDITGDRLEVIDDVATWTGNVRAVQGEAILSADRLIANRSADGDFDQLTAEGSVRYSNGKEAITGKVGVYDAAARTITISQDVVVTQGEQVMTGGELVYWIDTGKILFTAPSGRRIRGIFYAKGSGNQS